MFRKFHKVNQRIVWHDQTEAVILLNIICHVTLNPEKHFKRTLKILLAVTISILSFAIVSAVSLKLLQASTFDLARNSSTNFVPILNPLFLLQLIFLSIHFFELLICFLNISAVFYNLGNECSIGHGKELTALKDS